MRKFLLTVSLVAASSVLAWSMTAETGEPRAAAAIQASGQSVAAPDAQRAHGPFDYASTTRRGWRGQGTPPAYWPTH